MSMAFKTGVFLLSPSLPPPTLYAPLFPPSFYPLLLFPLHCQNYINWAPAFKFGCRRVVGVDIDSKLIDEAKLLLSKKINQAQQTHTPVYSPFNSTAFTSTSSSSPPHPRTTFSPVTHTTTYPSVEFRAEDFITSNNTHDKYDTITW